MPLTMTAVIVTYESATVLPRCLAALEAENIPALVVDNASGDGSAELARSAGASVIVNARNEGFGRAVNIGAAAVETDCILIVNPDAVVRQGFGDSMRQALQRYPDAGILGPRIVGPDGAVFFPTRSLLSPYLQNEKRRKSLPEGDCCVPFLSGACYLVPRLLFVSLGGFDPNIFLFYEDNDLCRRVADSGKSIIYVHDASLHHAQGQSSSAKKGRRFRTRWHYAWSRSYVCRKYGLRDPSLASLPGNALKYGFAVLTGQTGKIERYGGAVAGAFAAIRRKSALQREGLQ